MSDQSGEITPHATPEKHNLSPTPEGHISRTPEEHHHYARTLPRHRTTSE
jgi:hypothetical protein